MPRGITNRLCRYNDWRIIVKKQKNKIKQQPIKGKLLQNHCRPVKRAAFFHRIGNRYR